MAEEFEDKFNTEAEEKIKVIIDGKEPKDYTDEIKTKIMTTRMEIHR